jgi:hypothetical protein
MFEANKNEPTRRPWLNEESIHRRIRLRPLQAQAPRTSFDADSGQVYTEKTAPARERPKENWVHVSKRSKWVKQNRANRIGPASLLDLAKAAVIKEIRNLTADHLRGMPTSIGMKLWDELVDR